MKRILKNAIVHGSKSRLWTKGWDLNQFWIWLKLQISAENDLVAHPNNFGIFAPSRWLQFVMLFKVSAELMSWNKLSNKCETAGMSMKAALELPYILVVSEQEKRDNVASNTLVTNKYTTKPHSKKHPSNISLTESFRKYSVIHFQNANSLGCTVCENLKGSHRDTGCYSVLTLATAWV